MKYGLLTRFVEKSSRSLINISNILLTFKPLNFHYENPKSKGRKARKYNAFNCLLCVWLSFMKTSNIAELIWFYWFWIALNIKMANKGREDLTWYCAGGGPSPVSAPPGVHEDSLDLPELFCSLGSLIVEGRLPAESEAEAGTRGYTEGPHVELPGKISRHKCSDSQYLVSTENWEVRSEPWELMTLLHWISC